MDPGLIDRAVGAPREGPAWPVARRWLRRYAWSWLTVVAVVGALVGIVAVVRTSAAQKDQLRQAQIALAAAPGTLASVHNSPLALLAGAPAGPSEFPLSKALRTQLASEIAGLNRFWTVPLARTMRAEVAVLDAYTAQMMALIATHDLRNANAIENRYVQPLVTRLGVQIQKASSRLVTETKNADETAWLATLGVVGVAGLLLVLSLLGLAAAGRRRERHASERQVSDIEQTVLRESERRLKALVEHGSDMITVLAADTTVLYQAGAVFSMLGYQPHELEGAKLTDWLDPDDWPLLFALCATERSGTQELRLRHRDGSLRTFEARATSLLDHPEWEGVVLNIWDVSERKELEDRLRHQAFHDALTGLPNRALFADRVEHALARAQRAGEPIAVLLIDLDDFKSINDSLGHATGDQVLIEVAARLDASVRGADTVARLGGDEFAVILEDGESAANAERSAERILAVFSTPFELDGRLFVIAASVGIARAGRGTSASELVRDADVAMYKAKTHGKNRHAAYDPSLHLAIRDRLELKADLLRAEAAGDQFEVYYQPIVTLDEGVIVGLEALVRWNHPTRGLLQPGAFIALAEEIGAIGSIGRTVLNQACRQARRWSDDFNRPLPVAVNVSARQLDDPHFVGYVRDALSGAGLSADRLVLEITETELMTDPDHSARSLQTLRDLGVRIALDDFGTGYSSLSRLQRLPIDIVKVERNFAASLHNPSTQSALIQTVLDIAKTMHLTTIAERIETRDQLHQLQELACPMGQGFLFSHPLPAEAIDALLANGADYADDIRAAVDATSSEDADAPALPRR